MSKERHSNKDSGMEKASTGDGTSARGVFGWTLIDSINIPFIWRHKEKYLCVKIVEDKLLCRFPKSFSQELGDYKLPSYRMTFHEQRLLNEINIQHCDYEYGKALFSEADIIVKLDEFEKFYQAIKDTFPEEVLSSHAFGIPLPPAKEIREQKYGWFQIGTAVCPYVQRDHVKFVLLQVVKHTLGLVMNDVPVPSIATSECELDAINRMCLDAGLDVSFNVPLNLVPIDFVREYHRIIVLELPNHEPVQYAIIEHELEGRESVIEQRKKTEKHHCQQQQQQQDEPELTDEQEYHQQELHDPDKSQIDKEQRLHKDEKQKHDQQQEHDYKAQHQHDRVNKTHHQHDCVEQQQGKQKQHQRQDDKLFQQQPQQQQQQQQQQQEDDLQQCGKQEKWQDGKQHHIKSLEQQQMQHKQTQQQHQQQEEYQQKKYVENRQDDQQRRHCKQKRQSRKGQLVKQSKTPFRKKFEQYCESQQYYHNSQQHLHPIHSCQQCPQYQQYQQYEEHHEFQCQPHYDSGQYSQCQPHPQQCQQLHEFQQQCQNHRRYQRQCLPCKQHHMYKLHVQQCEYSYQGCQQCYPLSIEGCSHEQMSNMKRVSPECMTGTPLPHQMQNTETQECLYSPPHHQAVPKTHIPFQHLIPAYSLCHSSCAVAPEVRKYPTTMEIADPPFMYEPNPLIPQLEFSQGRSFDANSNSFL